MPFEKELPKWEAPGIEPPESKKQEGWDAGDKPPAGYFNWQWNKTFEALKELQERGAEKGEIERIESVLDNHISDNIRHITETERSNWNSAEQNAKNASVNKIAVYQVGGDIDPNTTQDAYILTNHPNCPRTNSGFWHIRTYFYSSTTDNRAQMAIRYAGSDEMYIRRYHEGWSSWQRVWHEGNNPSGGVSNGYQVFASGKIMQCGGGTYSSGDTVTFPIAFPGNVRSVVCSTSGSQSLAVQAGLYTPTSFVVNFDGGPRSIRYIAFGD